MESVGDLARKLNRDNPLLFWLWSLTASTALLLYGTVGALVGVTLVSYALGTPFDPAGVVSDGFGLYRDVVFEAVR